MKNKVFLATCHHIVKAAIRKSGFLDDVSDNRLNAIITNNLEPIFQDKQSFLKRSPLAVAVEHFGTAAGNDPDDKTIKSLIFEKHSVIGSDVIDSTIGAFADKLAVAKKELSQAHIAVEDLVAKFQASYERYKQPDKKTLINNINLPEESWVETTFLGPEDLLISEINNSTGFGGNEDHLPLRQAYDTFINGLQLRIDHYTPMQKAVILPEERKTAIVDAITSVSGLTRKTTAELVAALLSAEGVKGYLDEIKAIPMSSLHTGLEQTKNLITYFNKFTKGYNNVIASQESVETYLDHPTVKANINHFRDMQKGLTYYLSFQRYCTCKNIVILPTGKLNKDLRDHAKEMSISKDTMKQAVHFFDVKSPAINLTLDALISNKELLQKMYDNTVEHEQLVNKLDEKGTRKAAFEAVASAYLVKNGTFGYMGDYAKHLVSEVGDSDYTAEYGFYNLVMMEKNVAPLSKTLYNEFSSQFSQLAAAGEPTKRTVEEAKAIVLTKNIGKFLADNFC